MKMIKMQEILNTYSPWQIDTLSTMLMIILLLVVYVILIGAVLFFFFSKKDDKDFTQSLNCEWKNDKGQCMLTTRHISCGVVDLRSCALLRTINNMKKTKSNGKDEANGRE